MLMLLILPRHPKFATRCAAAAIHRLTLFPLNVFARLGPSPSLFEHLAVARPGISAASNRE
jgi:hypothetical protein